MKTVFLPQTWVHDTPLSPGEVEGAPANWPRNANDKYQLNITTRDALVYSRNPSMVRIGDYAGIDKVVDTLHSAGLLRGQTRDPTLYLGNTPASPWELAAAYTTFPNQGTRVRPYLIERITETATGNILYQEKQSSEQGLGIKQIVARPETTGLVSTILEDVTRVGTARSLRSVYGFQQPAAGKTGTTNESQDAWFAGYTSSLTGCVWVGFDKPATILRGGSGSSLALPIWAKIMNVASRLPRSQRREALP